MKKYGRLEYIIINYYLLLSVLKSTTVLLVTKAVTYVHVFCKVSAIYVRFQPKLKFQVLIITHQLLINITWRLQIIFFCVKCNSSVWRSNNFLVCLTHANSWYIYILVIRSRNHQESPLLPDAILHPTMKSDPTYYLQAAFL